MCGVQPHIKHARSLKSHTYVCLLEQTGHNYLLNLETVAFVRKSLPSLADTALARLREDYEIRCCRMDHTFKILQVIWTMFRYPSGQSTPAGLLCCVPVGNMALITATPGWHLPARQAERHFGP